MYCYRGRFAPSPTGQLHFGSLFAAVISYLDARANQGAWLIRIEDIDPLREQPGAAQAILHSLARHGMESDQPVRFQSEHSLLYERTLDILRQHQYTFDCPCSRRYLDTHHGIHAPACQIQSFVSLDYAIKFKADFSDYHWQDIFQKQQHARLKDDFVLKRKEGFYAYQLAVVADDIDQKITHVIRGYDLLDSTPMQLALFQALQYQTPIYGHFPVLINHTGQKLSKQNRAPAIDDHCALANLMAVFNVIGLRLPCQPKSCTALLEEATLLWNRDLFTTKAEHIQV